MASCTNPACLQENSEDIQRHKQAETMLASTKKEIKNIRSCLLLGNIPASLCCKVLHSYSLLESLTQRHWRIGKVNGSEANAGSSQEWLHRPREEISAAIYQS
jgi:hypothetical protein